MDEEDWKTVKRDTRVKIKYFDRWVERTVTIVTESQAKVLFDGDYDLSYWYYPCEDLELVKDIKP